MAKKYELELNIKVVKIVIEGKEAEEFDSIGEVEDYVASLDKYDLASFITNHSDKEIIVIPNKVIEQE